MSRLDGKLSHVERDERDLKMKESQLEKKETDLEHHNSMMDNMRNMGNPFEPAMDQVRIHMVPLMPHMPQFESQNSEESLFGPMHRLSDMIKNRIHFIQSPGPAESHHMGPIIPLNIMQTGAHPKFEKKEEPKKDEKKEEPKK